MSNELSLSELTRIVGELERLANLTVQPDCPIRLVANATGYHLLYEHDYFLAEVLSGSNPYAWREVTMSEGVAEEKTDGLSGTATANPLYELNGTWNVEAGTIVRAFRGIYGVTQGQEWLFDVGSAVAGEGSDCGPGCGWVAGLRKDNCVQITTVERLGMCANDAPDVDSQLCWEEAESGWTENGCLVASGNDGSGVEPDPWWCLAGDCVQAASNPGGATGPYATQAECATACGISGTFGDDCDICEAGTPATWTTTLTGFGPGCGGANGTLTLTQSASNACDFSGTISGGFTADLSLAIGGADDAALTIYDEVDESIVAIYRPLGWDRDCCSPLTLHLVTSTCAAAPSTVTLTPSC